MPKPDDLEALQAERTAADLAYNDALTRLDAAIQRLPANFPHPPPGPDEQQITPLNTLWKVDAPTIPGGLGGRFVAAVRRAVAPLFEQQRAFNSAIVDHINRNVVVDRQTRESIDTTLTLLRDTIVDLVHFQSLLVVFLQQITPYVDTRDRRHENRVSDLDARLGSVQQQLQALQHALESARRA